jgi:hypothetical protein
VLSALAIWGSAAAVVAPPRQYSVEPRTPREGPVPARGASCAYQDGTSTRGLFGPEVSPVLKHVILVALASASAGAGLSPFAVEVVGYAAGSNATAGYTDATAALGSAERFTGEGVFPSGVTPFNPAFGTDELVSVGAGGQLSLRFERAITNSVSNAFGVDFIVFGNAGFVDQSWFDADPSNDGTGVLGSSPTLFGGGGTAEVWVSADNQSWSLATITSLDLFPTLGYQDYGVTTPGAPGTVETDFTRAMDPSVSLASLAGMDFEDLRALYGSSGGGIGIDISGTGLSSASYVRFVNAGGAAFEIDAVAVVPAPGVLLTAGLGLAALRRRR